MRTAIGIVPRTEPLLDRFGGVEAAISASSGVDIGLIGHIGPIARVGEPSGLIGFRVVFVTLNWSYKHEST
jgi:hypothetical protein